MPDQEEITQAFSDLNRSYLRVSERSADLTTRLNFSFPAIEGVEGGDSAPLAIRDEALQATLQFLTNGHDDISKIVEVTQKFAQMFFQLCKVEIEFSQQVFSEFEKNYQKLGLNIVLPSFPEWKKLVDQSQEFLTTTVRGQEAARIDEADGFVIKLRDLTEQLRLRETDLQNAKLREDKNERRTMLGIWLGVGGLVVGVAGIGIGYMISKPDPLSDLPPPATGGPAASQADSSRPAAQAASTPQ